MHFQKFISMILAVALTLSLCVVSVPSAFAKEEDDSNLVTWFLDVVRDNLDQAYQFVRQVSANYVFSSGVNHVTPSALQQACNDYRSNFYNNLLACLDDDDRGMAIWDGLIDGYDFCYICKDEDTGRVRLRNKKFGYWITNDLGEYPWCTLEEWNAATKNVAPLPSFDPSVGKWVSHSVLQSFDNKTRVAIVSVDELKYLASEVQKKGWQHVFLSNIIIDGVGYICIRRQYENTEGDEFDMVWCNSNGCPYVVIIELDKAASQNPTVNKYVEGIDKTPNSPTYNQSFNIDQSSNDDNRVIIDLSNGTFNLPTVNGDYVEQKIESVIWDNSDHSYHVTTYNQTFNLTNNFYEYNYYTYNIQYTYNNTYITYIGSTAEYQPKEWELYYELPDGRSSADLTEEDVAGLSFQFNDCINYKKSATDTALRALYHFDGNTNDSGFFSDKTSFVWNSGASITYMESNAFNGALYLDEKAHQFTITLPSNIGSGDFTLQWRYYQNAATTTDNNENYITVGGTKMLGWSEQNIYNGSGTKLAGLSVGTWQELAVVRNNGTVYLYHNGVKIGSVANSAVLTNKIVFYLGANSRAHSMLDEMRFVKGALYTGGKAYTPTAVPFDTNAVLVLPDSPVPVVDEYWNIPSVSATYKYNVFNTAYSPTYVSADFSPSSNVLYYKTSLIFDSEFFQFRNTSYTLPSISRSLLYDTSTISGVSSSVSISYNILPLFLAYSSSVSANLYSDYFSSFPSSPKSYTVTALFTDGSVGSCTFTVPVYSQISSSPSSSTTPSSSTLTNEVHTISTGSSSLSFSFFTVYQHDYSSPRLWSDVSSKFYTRTFLSDYFLSGLTFYNSSPVLYLDVREGSTPTTGFEHVVAEYDPTELQPNTAAIQTDIPINGYTVGGVRPTFPQRGDVWFAVEGSRISGVQIYNGQAWEETNARWWTGSRWIPIYAFDLVTLSDMWDITSVDGSGADVTPPIASDYGFWNWWKKAWNDFTNKLFGILGDSPGSGPGSGDGSGSDDKGFLDKIIDALGDGIAALIRGLFDLITEIFKTLLSVVTDLLSALFSFITDTVLNGIKSFFSFFTDGSLFEFFQPDSDSGGVGLPEGIAAVFSIFAGIIMLLPWELRSLLIFGLAAAVLIAVFRFAIRT